MGHPNHHYHNYHHYHNHDQGDPELPAPPALLAGQLGGGDRRRWRVWKPSCSSNQADGRLRQCAGKIFMEYIYIKGPPALQL